MRNEVVTEAPSAEDIVLTLLRETSFGSFARCKLKPFLAADRGVGKGRESDIHIMRSVWREGAWYGTEKEET